MVHEEGRSVKFGERLECAITAWIERGLAPNWLLELIIRALCWQRLRVERSSKAEQAGIKLCDLIARLDKSAIADLPEMANQQHYEVPAEFYLHVLGKNLKYSSCYFDTAATTLDAAEDAMLQLTVERAQIRDGDSILELGCGWGSLTLWMAAQFPRSSITALSNSGSQREFILSQAKQRGLKNVSVITSDINNFTLDQRFDRIVSVEMFEHLRNYRELFKRIRSWLKPQGTLFVHIFCHHKYAYLYEVKGVGDWMSRYFFSGGTMPSEYLFSHFNQDLCIEKQWRVGGEHYARTARAWVGNLESKRQALIPIFEKIYGQGQGLRWFMRWKLFFLACAVLFGYRRGNEWLVAHYLFRPRS